MECFFGRKSKLSPPHHSLENKPETENNAHPLHEKKNITFRKYGLMPILLENSRNKRSEVYTILKVFIGMPTTSKREKQLKRVEKNNQNT